MSSLISSETIEGASLKEDVIKILVKSDLGEQRQVELEIGSRASVILDIFASEWGTSVDELFLIRDSEEEVVDVNVTIDANYPHQRRHHVHKTTEVRVEVFYQAGSHHHMFKRQTTIEEVLTWALKTFSNIDPQMATEFELARHNTTEQLPGAEHIGHLAGHHDQLLLDLVRGDIANGGPLGI